MDTYPRRPRRPFRPPLVALLEHALDVAYHAQHERELGSETPPALRSVREVFGATVNELYRQRRTTPVTGVARSQRFLDRRE